MAVQSLEEEKRNLKNNCERYDAQVNELKNKCENAASQMASNVQALHEQSKEKVGLNLNKYPSIWILNVA